MYNDPWLALLEQRDVFEGVTPPSDVVIVRHTHFPGNTKTDVPGDQQDLGLISTLSHEADYTVGLSDRGRADAPIVGELILRLLPDAEVCISGNYLRHVEMAQLAFPGLRLVVTDRLRERYRGDVTGIPKSRLQKRTDELNANSSHLFPYTKEEDPLGWWPFGGEPLLATREWLRTALTHMAQLSPDKPIVVSTSGEVLISGRSAKELGNMDNADLQRGLTPDCPGLTVENGQFDWWTRRDPESGELSKVFTHVRSISPLSFPPTDTGFIRIRPFVAP